MASFQRARAADRRAGLRPASRPALAVAAGLAERTRLAGHHRDGASRAVGRGRLLSVRRLAAADRHRVPHRRGQRPGRAAGRGGGGVRAALGLLDQQARGARSPGGLLRAVPAGVFGPAGHHADRRRVQRLRVPGDLVAGHLRAGRPRLGSARTARGVPIPDHGDGRGHVPAHRHRLPVHDDRHAEHGRPGRPPAGSPGPCAPHWRSSSSASA